jgi:hypothetical protein
MEEGKCSSRDLGRPKCVAVVWGEVGMGRNGRDFSSEDGVSELSGGEEGGLGGRVDITTSPLSCGA